MRLSRKGSVWVVSLWWAGWLVLIRLAAQDCVQIRFAIWRKCLISGRFLASGHFVLAQPFRTFPCVSCLLNVVRTIPINWTHIEEIVCVYVRLSDRPHVLTDEPLDGFWLHLILAVLKMFWLHFRTFSCYLLYDAHSVTHVGATVTHTFINSAFADSIRSCHFLAPGRNCMSQWFSTGVPRVFAKCAARLRIEEWLYKSKSEN
jgi:hypothetical protein